jgi:DNA uptake protein ComE-like DNA-binding protein
MMETRGNFGSKLGIILATAGSAVGLGNIWRFPYMTGQNGGAAFILIYLVCIILLGLPGMLSEFIIGRHSASNAARAYTNLGKHKAWGALGLMGIITSMIIFGFYSVVAGWCLQYLYASIIGGVHGDPEYVKSYFQTFASDPIRPVLWALGFILLTHMVVVRGVRNGIEKASKILMPLLFILLVVIVIASCSLPGAMKGVEFLLRANEHIEINGADTTLLMKIPGIGSYYASRIVRYRDRLGGFASAQQLEEIDGLPESSIAYIKIDEQQIRKMNLNKLTLNQLKKHPYLNFYQAKEICDYRRLKGPLHSIEDLKLLKDFPPDEIERLKPYICF